MKLTPLAKHLLKGIAIMFSALLYMHYDCARRPVKIPKVELGIEMTTEITSTNSSTTVTQTASSG